MVSLQAAIAMLVLSGSPDQTVMLDFYADWCGPCRAMDSTVHDISAMGYPVRRVNIDHEPALALQYHVKNIPCFVMVVDGREVDRVVGGTSFTRLQRMCKAAMTPPTRPKQSPAMLANAGPPITVPLSQNHGPTTLPADAMVAAPAVATSAGPVARVNWTPQANGPTVSDAALVAATVRLRVEDPDGRSCGSGTIIDARQGVALVLTCAHIFRDSHGKGRIEVDLFGPGSPRQVTGTLISYDLSKDVGLVKIAAPSQVVVARVAPPSYHVAIGEPVVTVGCNNGDDPTPRHSRVMNVDKFKGPANLQVEGEPVEGRSGGGVFSADGMIVGICNAADRIDHAGYCAALPTIYAEMDRVELGFLYKEEVKESPVLLAAEPAPTPRAMTPVPPVNVAPAAFAPPADGAQFVTGEQAAMEEIHRRVKEGAEVVCVIRNARDPQAKSEVIMLGGPKNVEETSWEVPRDKKPILEWDATRGYLHHTAITGGSGM